MHALSEIGGALGTSGFVHAYLAAAEQETGFQSHGMELYLMRHMTYLVICHHRHMKLAG